MLQFIIRSSLVASQLPLLKGAKCDSAEQGIVRFWEGWCGKGGHGRVLWAMLKHYCFTTGHHFDEC